MPADQVTLVDGPDAGLKFYVDANTGHASSGAGISGQLSPGGATGLKFDGLYRGRRVSGSALPSSSLPLVYRAMSSAVFWEEGVLSHPGAADLAFRLARDDLVTFDDLLKTAEKDGQVSPSVASGLEKNAVSAAREDFKGEEASHDRRLSEAQRRQLARRHAQGGLVFKRDALTAMWTKTSLLPHEPTAFGPPADPTPAGAATSVGVAIGPNGEVGGTAFQAGSSFGFTFSFRGGGLDLANPFGSSASVLTFFNGLPAGRAGDSAGHFRAGFWSTGQPVQPAATFRSLPCGRPNSAAAGPSDVVRTANSRLLAGSCTGPDDGPRATIWNLTKRRCAAGCRSPLNRYLPGNYDSAVVGINSRNFGVIDASPQGQESGKAFEFRLDQRGRPVWLASAAASAARRLAVRLVPLYRPRGGTSVRYAINDLGESVGAVAAPGGRYVAEFSFLHRHWEVAFAGHDTIALGVNDLGWGVGEASAGSDERAMLFLGRRAIDLNALIAPGSGWVLERANAIDGQGRIVGTGLLGGVERAFLLEPKMGRRSIPGG